MISVVILGLVTAQRLGELRLSNRNTRNLLDKGAVETGPEHYPYMVALHCAWLVGLWVLAWDRPADPVWTAIFVVLQIARLWVIATLGERWTTRIITVPGASLVTRGPYRLVAHPNYLVVAAEIAVLPLAFGLVGYALVFSILNAGMLWVRIRAEAGALAAAIRPSARLN